MSDNLRNEFRSMHGDGIEHILILNCTVDLVPEHSQETPSRNYAFYTVVLDFFCTSFVSISQLLG
jgi:hypothetical protein